MSTNDIISGSQGDNFVFFPVLLNQAIATSLAFLLSFNSFFAWPLSAIPTTLFGVTSEAVTIDGDLAEEVESESERKAYLRALMSVIAADGAVSADEIIRIYELFNIYETPRSERLSLINHIGIDTDDFRRKKLSKKILQNEDIRYALAKDVLLFQEESDNAATRRAVGNIVKQLALSTPQLNVLSEIVSMENLMLQAMNAGEAYRPDPSSMKELTAQAAAVGLPIAALNFAGIAGFSAAGITSGLAALGSASGLAAAVPFLNPMTAGVGALVLGGVAVKKGADYLMHRDDSSKALLAELTEERRQASKLIISDLPEIRRPHKREILSRDRQEKRQILADTLEEALDLIRGVAKTN